MKPTTPPTKAAQKKSVKVETEERGLGFERLVFFSDAVFAIAITLLALEVKVGEIPDEVVNVELPRRLFELWPQLLGYALGFTVIGAFWMSHHSLFTYIQRYDRRLLWLNLFFLAMIAISPFPTTVIGEYGFFQSAEIFYALSVILAGLAKVLLWWYASHNHRLIDADLPASTIRQITLRGWAVPVIFLLSIPLTWVSPALTIAVWCLGPIVSYPLFRRTD